MAFPNPANAYRQTEARGATPVGLIALLYDAAVESLYAALRAMERNDVEQRTARLNHALTVLGVLESSLNYDRGGEVAQRLGQFYRLARAQMLQASVHSSPALLRELAGHFVSLRDAWKQVEASLGTPAAHPTAETAPPAAVPRMARSDWSG
ncbi:MAG TPA: flagellar export chaperone FliS [Terriglobia bacterium]|nr:flagellar export chaperone FliS [Terriglobia bacterium]